MKKCNCCDKEHTNLPEKYDINEHGLWFDCECGSTLFISTEEQTKGE